MKPALTTRSGRCARTAAVSAASQPARSEWSPRSTAKPGTPARSALARPSMPVRSAPTATTAAG